MFADTIDKKSLGNSGRRIMSLVICFVIFTPVFIRHAAACNVTEVTLYVRKDSTDPWGTSATICMGESVEFKAECQVDEDSEGRPIKCIFDYGDGSSTDTKWYDDNDEEGPEAAGTYSVTSSRIYYEGNTNENQYHEVEVKAQRADPETKSFIDDEETDTCQVTVVEVESVDTDPAGQEVACTDKDVTFRVVTSTSGNYDLIYWWGGGTPETQDGGETFTTSWSSPGTEIVGAECDTCDESREIDIIDGFTVLPSLASLCDDETKDFEAWTCVDGIVENVTADSTFDTSNGSMKKPTGEAAGPGNYRLHPDTPSSSEGSDYVKATYDGQETDDDHDCALTVLCCCEEQNSHMSANKNVSDLVGVEATIKTRYGDLCCEDCPLQPAGLQAAILGIVDDESGGMGETGYLRAMIGGELNKGRFAEVTGPGHHLKIDLAPSEGSSITYKVELDKSTGYWKFYYNETLWHTFTDFSSEWQNKTCGRLYWSGEINNLEDDMPGTSGTGNTCDFTGCEYKKDGGSYQPAGLTSADVDEPTDKWGSDYVSGTAFSIWDKEPGEKTCP